MAQETPARASRALRARWPAILQVATHIGALVPLALLVWDGLHGNLTADPVRAVILRTGKTALVLLLLSLACTPASTWLGFRRAISLRRPLGLYAFLYGALHLLTFVALDYGLDVGLLRQALFEKPYALAGLACFLLLVPLAVTATRGWMRRLGKRWKRLHRLVYLALLLALVHYLWLVKAGVRTPLPYVAIGLLLLAARLPWIRRAAARWRKGSGRVGQRAGG